MISSKMVILITYLKLRHALLARNACIANLSVSYVAKKNHKRGSFVLTAGQCLVQNQDARQIMSLCRLITLLQAEYVIGAAYQPSFIRCNPLAIEAAILIFAQDVLKNYLKSILSFPYPIKSKNSTKYPGQLEVENYNYYGRNFDDY